MKLHIVTKAPVEMGDAYSIVGVFTNPVLAENAVSRNGAGNYLIAAVSHDKAYKDGELLDVRMISKVPAG
jgi:hypothetical protein